MTLFFPNSNKNSAHFLSLKGSGTIVIISLLITGSSAVGSNYVAPQITPPIHWHGEIVSRINSDPLDPKVLNLWWETLQAPVLTSLVDRSISGNLNLFYRDYSLSLLLETLSSSLNSFHK